VAAHLTRARLDVLAGLVSSAVSSPGSAAHVDVELFGAWAGQLSASACDPADPSLATADTELSSPRDAVADLMARWQRPAAHSALLLVPSASGSGAVVAPWTRLIAAAHALIGCIVSAGEPGPLHLEIADTGEGVTVTVDDAGPAFPADAVLPNDDEPRPDAWLACTAVGGRAVGLAIAHHVVSAGGLSMSVTDGPLGGVRVVVTAHRR
jgi:hypothetical protein